MIRVGGYDVVSQPRHANHLLGYVPDEPYVYDKLSGREFLQFVADMHGLSPYDSAVRIEREVHNFDLSTFVDDLAESYSHGMKQRLAFAAALLHDPCVFIVDEPMVGLDPRSVRLVKDLLRRKASEGMTVFMSTHSLSVAEEISDRIGIVEHGELKIPRHTRDITRPGGRPAHVARGSLSSNHRPRGKARGRSDGAERRSKRGHVVGQMARVARANSFCPWFDLVPKPL